MIFYSGTLLRLDGVMDSQGEIFDHNTAIELPSNEVKVTLDFHEGPEFWLGKATLYFAPGELRYDMILDNSKLPQHALETLIPCAGGMIKNRNGQSILHALITSIGLTAHRNSDARIKPLKDQT
jgi:hypothetical protein